MATMLAPKIQSGVIVGLRRKGSNKYATFVSKTGEKHTETSLKYVRDQLQIMSLSKDAEIKKENLYVLAVPNAHC
jgi:hypothetical protein